MTTGGTPASTFLGYVSLETGRPTAGFDGGLYPVAAGFLGSVEGFVSSLDYLFHLPRLRAWFRDSYADCDAESAGRRFGRKGRLPAASCSFLIFRSAARAPRGTATLRGRAHSESRFLDKRSERLEIWRNFLHGFSSKENGELFSANPKCLPASAHPR